MHCPHDNADSNADKTRCNDCGKEWPTKKLIKKGIENWDEYDEDEDE